jgi:hypothetical protein
MEFKYKFGEAIPVVIATIFLFTPVGFLVRMGWKHRHDPAPAYNDYIKPVQDDYIRAVHAAMQPESSYVSRALVSINRNQPLTVATWKRNEQVPDLQGGVAKKDIWVTVVPQLKSFCQDYVRSHGADADQLNLRLKQRLGLPPDPSYQWFVELTLAPKDVSKLFRPCGDPSTDTNTCEPASPPKPYEITNKLKTSKLPSSKDVQQYWVLSRYYETFASDDPYPWTSLGYTFDWAPKEGAVDDFVRWGESEFVIPAGTPIQVTSQTDTVTYCTPH